MRSVGEALIDATSRLTDAGVASPDYDARALMSHLTGENHLLLDRRADCPDGYDELVFRRANREPLQHILGSAPFCHLELEVGPGVFIPRPETEILADWAANHARIFSRPIVVDLCTGSGAIAEYVATAVPSATVYGVELQVPAFAFARRNAPHATIIQGDVTGEVLPELAGTVDVVVSNPPYVPESDDLDPEVYADPHEAVFSGPDGLEVIRGMMPSIRALLRSGGVVGIEHDDTTSEAVQEVLAEAGFIDIAVLKDLTGRARFVTASKL